MPLGQTISQAAPSLGPTTSYAHEYGLKALGPAYEVWYDDVKYNYEPMETIQENTTEYPIFTPIDVKALLIQTFGHSEDLNKPFNFSILSSIPQLVSPLYAKFPQYDLAPPWPQ